MRYSLYCLSLMMAGLLVNKGAFAHSTLARSVPAEQSVVEQIPAQMSLQFNKEIRLVQVTLSHKGGKALSLAVPKSFVKQVTIPISLDSYENKGRYTVAWRGLGKDGHIVQGQFFFNVR